MFTADSIKSKKVIVRADLDVPIKDGRVENDFRLKAALPTLALCLQSASKTLLVGHLGRPTGFDPSLSLKPVQKWLEANLNQQVPLIDSGFSPGEWWTGESPITLLDNIRFSEGEENLDRAFVSRITAGADIYIYDAFAAYRPSSTLVLIPEVLPTYTGVQFDTEVASLNKVLKTPSHPTLLIASGAKEEKLEIIKQMSPRFDKVILGGKFALASHLTPDGLDINEAALKLIVSEVAKAEMIVFNGPLGKYEDGIHTTGTRTVLEALKNSSAFTIIGGGDTLAAIPSLGFAYTDYGFVSTGGGSMLNFLATGTHPLLEILNRNK